MCGEDGGRLGLIPSGRGAESGHPLAEKVRNIEGQLGSVKICASRTKQKLRSAGR